jgi:branched-chain amino acid transport system permease protein
MSTSKTETGTLHKLISKLRKNSDLVIGLVLAVPIVILYIFALDSLAIKATWFLGTFTAIIVFFIGAISLDLEVGSMGLPNFGKVAFFALGANISALLYSEYGLPFYVGVIVALFVSALLGFVISIPTVKLRADYFAIMTIAGGEIIRLILQNESRWLWSTSQDGTKSQVITNFLRRDFTRSAPWDQKVSNLTTIFNDIGTPIVALIQDSGLHVIGNPIIDLGGSLELFIISDLIKVVGYLINAPGSIIALTGGIIRDFGSVFLWEIGFLVIFGIFAVFVYWFVEQVRKSPYGRTLRAIREDDISVTAVGKDVGRFRWQVTTLAAVICGLAGVLYGLTFSSFEAGEFRPFITFNLYIFIIIGGLGNSRGALIGTALATMFTRATQTAAVKALLAFELRPTDPTWGWLIQLLRVDVILDPENAAIIILGIILILFLLFKPSGLIPERKTDTEQYLSLLTAEERARSDAAVAARQSLTERDQNYGDNPRHNTSRSKRHLQKFWRCTSSPRRRCYR